jgi:hypothetical protein
MQLVYITYVQNKQENILEMVKHFITITVNDKQIKHVQNFIKIVISSFYLQGKDGLQHFKDEFIKQTLYYFLHFSNLAKQRK